jgi:hypothetical protein
MSPVRSCSPFMARGERVIMSGECGCRPSDLSAETPDFSDTVWRFGSRR